MATGRLRHDADLAGGLHFVNAENEVVPWGEAYARRAVESVSGFDWTHHRLCNFVILVDGERAHGKVDVVAQMQAPTADDGGAPPMLTVGGATTSNSARSQLSGASRSDT